MKKVILILFILLILLTFIYITLSKLNFNNSATYHSWTKAICNETHCQDYEIQCKGGEFMGHTPISGAIISIPENWEDPRDKKDKERICNF